MFYLISLSENIKRTYDLKKALLSKGLFFCTYVGRYDKLVPYSEHDPDVFLIDARHDRISGEKVCKYLRTHYGDSRIIALLTLSPNEASRFRYIKGCDFEITESDDVSCAELVLSYLERDNLMPQKSYRLLCVGETCHDTTLMSLPLALTKTEHLILGFLCADVGHISSPDLILSCCFADGNRLTPSNITTHISSINRKAEAITGRRLILSEKNVGYMLNPNM